MRRIGKSQLFASPVVLGTWAIGGWMWGGSDEKESLYAIDTALSNGINCIDTAPIYGFGKSEEIVGKAIKGRRDKVIVATKCGLVWNTDKGESAFRSNKDMVDKKSGDILVRRYLNPNSIREEVENSLKRLGTDYIDLYQTHWQEKTTAIEDTMDVLLSLKKEGKIREIGVSNASVEDIMKYRKYGIIASDQEKFSMIDRKNETSNLAYCRKHKLGFFAYSPLSFGLLTGRYSESSTFSNSDIRSTVPRFKPASIKAVNDMLKEFEPFYQKYSLSKSAFALAWALNFDGCSHVLAGSRKAEHVLDNISAMDVIIDKNDMAEIEVIIKKYLKVIEV